MMHAIRRNREFFIPQIIRLKNLVFKNTNNLLNNQIYNLVKDQILYRNIMIITKVIIITIKLLKGQKGLIIRKSFLIYKKTRKNLWRLMNLKILGRYMKFKTQI
jgi:hypothetical protein